VDDVSVTLNSERQRQAQRYAIAHRVLYLADLAIGAILLGGIVVSGGASALRDLTSPAPFGRIGTIAEFVLLLLLVSTVLTFPLTVYGGWVLPRRNGLSVQTIWAWLIDWLKGLAIGLVLGLVLVEVVYALLQLIPDWWWLATAVIYLLFTVVLASLAPILLLPLFFKLTPLDRPDLAERLEQRARQAGTRVRGVYRINLSSKTTAANAALMGLGNTRRIVLGDTLLDHYSPAEIDVVFTHELGHHLHRDVPRLIVGQSIVTLIGLYLCGLVLSWSIGTYGYQSIADPATLPILALTLGAFGLLSAPLTNYLSRRWEREADLYALQTTDDPQAFQSAMIRLANQNLAEYDPPAWVETIFYDHPAIARRVRLAESYARGTDG
jgi:STE24 endopeptidase